MRTARLILAAALAIGGTAATSALADTHATVLTAAQEATQQGTSAGVPPQTATGASGAQGNAFASNQIVGRIKSLGEQQRTVTVEMNGQNESFALGNATTVFVEGRLGTIQDLKEGQEVRAAFENRGGEKSVRWIEVTPAAPSPTQPAANPGGH